MLGECEVKNANVLLVRDELPIEALPSDIPENITIDISSLTKIGQTLGVSDLEFDRANIELKLSEEELEAPLVIVQEQKEEVAADDEGGEAAAESSDAAEDDKPTQEKAEEQSPKE